MQFDPAFGGVGCGTPGGAWAETVLLSFGSGSDGNGPGYGALIIDAAGNLYGTTSLGGARGRYYVSCGTIFKVAPDGTERVLYALKGGSDGGTPLGGLIADASGNLYGTTSAGGGTSGCYPYGSCSTVFKLAADGTETVLYAFQGGRDGSTAVGGLFMASNGNIYGTNVYGGANGGGTVFELTPNAAKTAWTEKVLYAFCTKTSCSDGAHSYAGLIGDASGNLYGTTINGGANGEGTVFKLAPEGAETVLYALCAKTNCADGANPENFGPLLADQAGNLSGTTVNGGGGLVCGGGGCGTVFKRAPDGTETVLHAFKGGSDAGSPKLGIIADPSGNLYGTTLEWLDGQFIQDGHGTVFKLRTEQVTSDFDGDGYSDILWQNTGGEVAIWKMNGTSVIGGGLGNRGPSWHAIATGHFYANGYSDILWQNTNGEIVIWEMNATSVIGGGSLGNPGSSLGRTGIPSRPAISTATATQTSCGRTPVGKS